MIPARVVGWDAVSGRDSLSLLKGRSSDVRQGDWVASYLDVQAGTESGVRDDLRVLARQTLVGWIEQSAPYVSRMVLLSDAHSKRKWRVNIVAMNRPNQQDTFVADGTEHADFALEGIGKGQMRVLDVNARYITEGQIRIGDVVTTDGSDPKLPLAMVIGDIVDLKKIKEQPLLYHAIVQHRCPPKDLTEVLVVDIPH